MQGPITVFEGNSYAGDSRILDLQPKEERLLSYAIDLGTEGETVQNQHEPQVTKIKIYKGSIESLVKERQSRTYNFKNRGTQDRALIVEHPYEAGWNFVEPKTPSERSRDFYRFDVRVAAGQSTKLDVVQERTISSYVNLTNMDDQAIMLIVRGIIASPKVKEAFNKVL